MQSQKPTKAAKARRGQTQLKCRKVTLADISLLRAWYSDKESKHQLYAAPSDETEFAYYMLQPHRFIVTESGNPIATFKIEEQGAAAVLGLLVAPDHRGRGVSKKVLQIAEEKSKDLGFHVLSVDIYSDNAAARAAFVAAGFREFIWYEKNI